MPTPFLAINWKDGTTPQARRYVTGTAATQGVTFGGLEAGSGVIDQAGQRIFRFRGHNTWIAVANTSIYRSTDAGASYSSVFGADAALGQGTLAGPFLFYPGGVATLVIVSKQSSSTNWYLFTSVDGITWTKTGPFSLIDDGDMPVQAVTFWRGSFYGFYAGTGQAGRTIVWNDSSVSSVSSGPLVNFSIGNPISFCVFNDRLFALGIGSAGAYSNRTLYEFVGGSWVVRDEAFLSGVSSGSTAAKYALFADPLSNNMVGVMLGATGASGFRAFAWDSALTRTEITSAIGIQSALGSAASTVRIAWLQDLSSPTISSYLYTAADGTSGTPFTVSKWNGIATPIVAIGSGGNVQHAMPFGNQIGGSVFWTSGQRHVERISATPILGGIRYAFRIYSPYATVDAVSVRWIKGAGTDEFPTTPYATLANPSAGSISGGNTITGLDAANNGATLYTVDWMAETDGFSTGDFAKTTPRIFA